MTLFPDNMVLLPKYVTHRVFIWELLETLQNPALGVLEHVDQGVRTIYNTLKEGDYSRI